MITQLHEIVEVVTKLCKYFNTDKPRICINWLNIQKMIEEKVEFVGVHTPEKDPVQSFDVGNFQFVCVSCIYYKNQHFFTYRDSYVTPNVDGKYLFDDSKKKPNIIPENSTCVFAVYKLVHKRSNV